MTRPNGVERNNVPSTISGVASNFVGCCVLTAISPVRYVQATVSWPTFSRVIFVSGEKRLPSASWP
jgi:hypothetical protein